MNDNDLNFSGFGQLLPAEHHAAAVVDNAGLAIKRMSLTEHGRIYGKILKSEPVKASKIPDQTRPIIVLPGKNGKQVVITEEMLSKHILFLGGIGCGKTNTINYCVDGIVRNMTDNDILIVFDTKGDFFEKFGSPSNTNHIVIGNNKKYENIAKPWNIYLELFNDEGCLEKKEMESMATEISKCLFENYRSETQPFFSTAATDIFKNTLIAFCREAKKNNNYEKLHNVALVDFIKKSGVKEFHTLFNSPGNEDMRGLSMYYGDPNTALTPQALGVFSTLKAMVNDLFTGVFCAHGGMPFSMRNLVREKGKKIVFIEYDLSVGQTLGPLYGLMVDFALKQALGGRGDKKGHTYFVIDELRLLDAPKHLGDALNFGRSQNVKIIAAIQSIRQLSDAFGEDAGKVVASGFMNSICFQSFDADTRKYITDRFGETYDNYAFDVLGSPANTQKGGHVVEDWDIMDLDVGEAFVNLFGFDPFRFDFKIYPNR